MKTRFIHSTSRRQPVYYKLKRQVVAEFQPDIERATGWRKEWLLWKRDFTLQMRYNELLFLKQTRLRSSLT